MATQQTSFADPKETEVWYRAYERWHCTSDEWGDPVIGGSYCRIYFTFYSVLRHTPCGVWVRYDGDKRWVQDGTKRQLCHPTKREAVEAFMHRKRRQAEILEGRAAGARRAMKLAQDTLDGTGAQRSRIDLDD